MGGALERHMCVCEHGNERYCSKCENGESAPSNAAGCYVPFFPSPKVMTADEQRTVEFGGCPKCRVTLAKKYRFEQFIGLQCERCHSVYLVPGT